MRKFLATLLALVMTLALMVPASWGENKETYQLPDSLEGKTVILHTNDVHGAIDKYAKVAALRDECYDKGAHQVILLDAGDYSQGSPYVSLSKGATALDMMALVGYDVITLGNHEFDYGFPHQNTQVRTLLVQKRVRPDKKTAAEIIVLCGSFLFAGVALTPRGAHK